MTILRAVARTMLASYFIVNGLKAMKRPEEFTEAAEPVAETLLPLANRTLPKQAAVYLPQDTTALVKATGIAQIVGGICLATGIGRRLGAVALAASMAPQLLASNPFTGDSEGDGAGKDSFLKNLALTGSVLLAAQDTEGRPDLAWRAKNRAELLGREAEHTKATISREAAHAKASLTREGKRAARKAKKVAAKATKTATKTLEGALK